MLEVGKRDQYRTVNDLLTKSQPSAVYNTLLILSAFIVASGLLLNNATIVIGGMLVTPVLTPVLAIALGLATGEQTTLKKEGIFVLKSFLTIVVSALILTILFGDADHSFVFDNSVRTAVLYFVVALASGIAATLAWTRKEIAEILPSVAVTVSLAPPLSLIGIGMGALDFEVMRVHFFIFLFNFLGIVVGSLAVFSMLKFYKAEKRVEEKTKEMK